MDEALSLTRVVAVVVDAEKVAELVENRFLPIAHPEGEDLQVRPVRFASHDASAVRVEDSFPVAAGGVDPLVGHRPIDSPVRPHGQPGHVVSSLANVDGVTPAQEGPLGGLPVLPEILVLPDVRLDGGVGRSLGP